MQVHSPPQRVALYARVSSEEQCEGQTIDSQIAELERFAMQSAWLVSKVYRDEGWSGAILARPALDELRDDASKGRFRAVLINDVDRLARDVSHLGVLKRDLERHGVQVVFRKLPAEKSPTQNLMVNILGSFAEFERELIADRTRRGKRHKVEGRGQYMGCTAPYGYRYTPGNRAAGKDGTLEVDREEARVVRQMYSWVAHEGLSAGKVLKRLSIEGIRPRKGSKKWASSSVSRILRNEAYVGVWHYNKHESYEPVRLSREAKYRRSPKSGRRLRARADWLPVRLPETLHIIARDQWEKVQRTLDNNLTFSPRNSKHVYLLTGLIRCAACGRRYVGDPCRGRFYYRCHGRCKKTPAINEDALNGTVWGALKKAVLNPRIIIKSISSLNERRTVEATTNAQELAEIEKSLQQIHAEESRMLEAYRQCVISAEQLGTELGKLDARRASAEVRQASLTKQPASPPLSRVTRSVSSYCSLIADQLEAVNAEAKRRLVRLLINEIVFDGHTARIKGIIPSEDQEPTPGAALPNHRGRESSPSRITTMPLYQYGHNPALEFLLTATVFPNRTTSKTTAGNMRGIVGAARSTAFSDLRSAQ